MVGKRVELNLDKVEIEKLQNVKAYEPIVRLKNLRLFDNSRISSKKSLTITELFSPPVRCR